MNVFVYGTLLYPSVRDNIIGRSVEYMRATLENYKRCKVVGGGFPSIIPYTGSHVEGQLLLNITGDEFVSLCRYEGGLYDTKAVDVEGADGAIHTAYAFVDCGVLTLLKDQWVPDIHKM